MGLNLAPSASTHLTLSVMNFTPTERAILNWFARHSADANLSAQISVAFPGKRERTSIGFFTELLLPLEFQSSLGVPTEAQIALEACGLFAPELDPFAGCLVHTRGGRISSLEVYAVGEGHPLCISTFEVRDVQGNIVDCRH